MHKGNFKSIGAIEGKVAIRAGQKFSFRQRFEPYQSTDFHKLFFNIRDIVPFVDVRDVEDFVSENLEDKLLDEAHKTKCWVRSDNHFINSLGTFRILINGTVVEEISSNIGEMDAILKKLNYSSKYNILKDHQNFGNTYAERYLDNLFNMQEYQVFPEFSKFCRMPGHILGGIELEIQLVVHQNYMNRVLDSGIGILPFTKKNGSEITEEDDLVADDILTVPTYVEGTTYALDDIHLFLWVEENAYTAPILNSHRYLHSTWAMQTRGLSADTVQNFEFYLGRPIKKFGFVFQTNSVNNNTQIAVSDFTGTPEYARIDGEENGMSYHEFKRLFSQCKKLISYELEYGKNKLPFDAFTQNYVYDGSNTTRARSWIRQLSYGNAFDLSGTFSTEKNDNDFGIVYIDSFPDAVDNDQKYIRLKLTFSAPPYQLNMHYFYEYETETILSYDGTGNCVQVIPNH